MLHNSICIKLVHTPCERGRFSNIISQWANMSSTAHPPPETVVSSSSCSSSSLQHKQQQLLSTSEWFQNVLNFFKHRTELHYGVILRNCANTMNIAKFKLHHLHSQTQQAIGHRTHFTCCCISASILNVSILSTLKQIILQSPLPLHSYMK
jgi:hypothetical protein